MAARRKTPDAGQLGFDFLSGPAKALETGSRSGTVRAGAVRSEAVRAEVVRSEVVRTEPVRTEPVRFEAVRPESVRPQPESVRPESVRPESVRLEGLPSDGVRSEATLSEAVQSEAGGPEVVGPGGARANAVDAAASRKPAGAQSGRSHLPRLEVVRTDAGRIEPFRNDAGRTDLARPPAARLEVVGVESPPLDDPDDEQPLDEPVAGDQELDEALRLESNLALLAGAGAGKTYSLITLCLHVLSGARRGHAPVPPANLCLLTFTDKAASEMRQRLRERLDRLANGEARDDRQETALEASFAALGQPMPQQPFWRALRDDLGAASIGTFHSLCTHLLRRAPAGSGVNPAFELLEERDARQLFMQCIERVVLERLERADVEVRELTRQFGFSGPFGLVSAIARAATAIREEGTPVDLIPVQDEAEAREAFLAAVRGLRLKATQTLRGLEVRDKQRTRVEEITRRLQLITLETWPEHRDALEDAVKGWRRDDLVALRDAIRGTREDGTGSAASLYASWRMAPFDLAVRGLIDESLTAYSRALTERGALDFTGLLVRARDLLRDSSEARADAQRRFTAVLVDEFQDTNRVQLELVLLLAERRAGAPRAFSRELGTTASNEVLRVELEPAALAVVGDRKQAIYDFRGADVAIFEETAKAIEAEGGQRRFLQASRRSTPAIVAFCNGQSQSVLTRGDPLAASLPFEVEFAVETDALTAVRTVAPPGPALVRLTMQEDSDAKPTVEALRELEAEALARALAQMLADPQQQIVPRAPRGTPARPVRGQDVAVLFQRFTQLETYRQALVRNGVRHRIVRGRGFYAAQEVIDLAALLELVADPSHRLSFAAVLRSPLVGLSDPSLVSLALDGAEVKGLRPAELLLQGTVDVSALSDDERERLARFRKTYSVLRRERDRLGLRQLLRVALDALEYRVAVAAGPFGEQALANLDKLLELAATRERQGVPVARFSRELLELADAEPSEAQGEVLDDADTEAVTLLTVHQAKGLEWPVVVVPELFTSSPHGGERVRFDRDVGLAVASFSDEPASSDRYLRCKALRSRREEAQRRRLLYVAMTRARDRLVLGLTPKSQKGTWASWLSFSDFWWAAFAQQHVATLDVATLPPGRPSPVHGRKDAAAVAEVKRVVEGVREALVAQARDVLVPVTWLQDFDACPRRFQLAHHVGLDERPRPFEWRDDEDEEGLALPPGDARTLGTTAHALLELTPLEWVGQPELAEKLKALHRVKNLPLPGQDEVHAWVRGFFESAYGRRLPRSRRVLRELPFVLRLHEGDFTVHVRGQLDLLVIDEAIEVVDYKATTSSPGTLERYAFQLGCYALAARRLVNVPEVPVRAGLSCLRDRDPSPRFLPDLGDAQAFERRLVELARALTTAQARQRWPQQPLARCQALGCGYVYRCHRS